MVRTAIISGGARGIGRCLARRFLERGYRVYILDIDDEELRHTTHSHLAGYTDAGMLESSMCNLRDIEDVYDKVAKAAGFLSGHIDVLVNNGGIASPHWKDGKTMYDRETVKEWQAYVETNLTAPFVVSQACLPFMEKQDPGTSGSTAPIQNDSHSNAGPCIIHIGSFRAHQSDPNQEGYASTKSGLLGLMHSMAVSLKPLGVRVNLVAPGRIKVAHESKQGDEQKTNWKDLNGEKDVEDHLTNRAGRPKDIADAVEFLVNAGFVTGQDITVDGGATKIKK